MKKLYRFYTLCLLLLLCVSLFCVQAFAVEDMWTAANRIIVDVYSKIAGVSTVLAGLMSAVAVVGAKLSNNQHKVDQAWDWLRRIWIAWAVINGSTGEVVVSSVSISTRNGWQIVPYTTDMAHEKVDAQLLGFKINDAQTSKTGDAETFSLTAPWTIAENGRLPISYDAVVSAVSKAVTEQEVLSIVFVLEWGGE